MTPRRSHTERGFVIYDELTDRYGHEVRVQQSSLATEDAVWIFCDAEAPHLTVKMAARVRDALDAFIREHSQDAP